MVNIWLVRGCCGLAKVDVFLFPCSPMYDPRMSVGAPSSNVSLSQPGFMMSRGMMADMDGRFGGAHPLHLAGSMGGLAGENKGSQGRASSVKSGDSLDRAHRSLSVEEDFDLDPEDEEDQPKVGVDNASVCHVTVM